MMIAESRKYISMSKVVSIGILIIFIGLLAAIYHPTFTWMWERWFKTDSYYSHGFLIPIISAVLVWLKRKELARTRQKFDSSKLGLIFLGLGLLLHISSAFTRVHFSSGFSLILVLLGLILYLFGRAFARVLLFPILFLLLMVPVPLQVIAMTTLKMKLFVAEISTNVVQLFGIATMREGSTVYMPTTSVVVADQCSGLRSLISLSALVILYVYLVKASYIRKTALVILSVPIAIIANVARVVAVLIVANAYGTEIVAAGMLDKVFGFLVFVIALVGLVIAGKLLKCQFGVSDLSNQFNNPPSDKFEIRGLATQQSCIESPFHPFDKRELENNCAVTDEYVPDTDIDNLEPANANTELAVFETRKPKVKKGKFPFFSPGIPRFVYRFFIAALLLLFTAALIPGTYSQRSYSGTLYTEEIPMIIGDWYGKNLPISERVYEILETRDTFTREYANPNGERMFFTVVFAQSNRKVAHPPEVCIRGAGWSISPAGNETISPAIGKINRFTMSKLLLERDNEKQIVLYLYKAGDIYTTNYYRQQINVVLNRILRKNSSAALIEITIPVNRHDLVEKTTLAKEFAKLALPILSERLP